MIVKENEHEKSLLLSKYRGINIVVKQKETDSTEIFACSCLC